MRTKNRNFFSEKPWFIGLTLACLIAGGLLITSFTIGGENSRLCSQTRAKPVEDYDPTPVQLQAIVHYATSKITPQQTLDEISVSFEVLKSRSPCNFLVFGLGFDSLMWNSLNPRGTTIFLEDNPEWVQRVLKTAPMLRAHIVKYRTQVREADDLLRSWRSLALHNLPDEIYEREWDLIMIDAPKGYFPDSPGRMAAIFSAAVMARNRRGSGVTHVFLHNIDRKVEKTFVQEFLCWKYLVKEAGRLGHFEIPSAANVSQSGGNLANFC
ncbi:hypothetical protein UlMin_040013 [Ulmus minor]